MATDPSFASTPRLGVGSVTTANTNRDGSGTPVPTTILTAGTSGTLITQITVQASGTNADGVLLIFLFDGTNIWLFDEIDYGAAVTPSTTASALRVTRTYSNVVLPNQNWSVRVSTTATTSSGAINVFVHGADL